MNYSVPKHLFKFNIDPTEDSESEEEEDLVDSDEDLEEDPDDCESVGPKRRRNDAFCGSSEAGETGPGMAVLGSVALSPRSTPGPTSQYSGPTSTSPLA